MKNILAALLIVLALLAFVGWQRWSAAQNVQTLASLSPANGVTMIHFYADW